MQLDLITPRFQMINGMLLRPEMRWPFMFMRVFPMHMGIWKGRTHVSEWVCRLERSPWRHKFVGFGASQGIATTNKTKIIGNLKLVS